MPPQHTLSRPAWKTPGAFYPRKLLSNGSEIHDRWVRRQSYMYIQQNHPHFRLTIARAIKLEYVMRERISLCAAVVESFPIR